MTSIRWRLLGEVGAEFDGTRRPLNGQRPRAVIAYLSLRNGKAATTEQVIDALWGDEPPKTARNSVQRFVADLRVWLEGDGLRLHTVDGGYRLDLDGTSSDVAELGELVAAGREALGDDDPEEASRLLAEGLSRWSGEPLAGVGDAPFAEVERVRLEEQRLGALEDRIDADLRSGRHTAVVDELESLVASHPYREHLWGQLMVALYRSGRQADALAAFQRVRTRLVDELGVEPTPGLQELEARILAHDPRLAGTDRPSRDATSLRGYVLHEVVGQRTGAVVHRATQTGLDRTVAVEVIRSDVANQPDFIRRFESAASLVAGLDHPAVVPVYDYWREPDHAYLVTRWMGGGTLRRRLERSGPLEADDAANLVERIGGALVSVHRAGAAHGALTTEAVLLDEHGDAFLSGFDVVDQGDDPVVDVTALAGVVRQVLSGLPPALAEALDRAGSGQPVEDFVAAMRLGLRSSTSAEAPLELPGSELDNPYKGLRAFQESDAGDFFGRSETVDRLVGLVGSERLVAVVGPSGSGKSSVVRAGLIPALRRGALASSDKWFVVDMIPGPSPFEELSSALRRVAARAPDRLFGQLAADDQGMRRAVDYVLPDDESELLLVVDQFEELFTLVTSEKVRARFIDSLVAAVTSDRSRLRVVLTLRADFVDRPLAYHGLGRLVSTSTELLTAMAPDQIERAIVLPAERLGVTFERGLVAEISSDVLDQPAALPLLQYALTELFDRRDGAVISLEAYDAAGGVLGALASRASQVFLGLDAEQQAVARQVLLRLVTVGEGTGDTRRRAPRSELRTLGPTGSVELVLEEFGRYRLLTFDHDPSTREPTVEVAHEALLTEWSILQGWISDSRDDVRTHRRLAAAAREWNGADLDPSYLLSGSRLAQIESWWARTDLALTGDEEHYVDASIQLRREQEEAEQERRANEAALEHRSNRRLRILVGVLGAAALVGGVLTFIALDQRNEADRSAVEATVQGLELAGRAELANDPELSMLLAIEAADLAAEADQPIEPSLTDALHEAFASFRLVARFEPASVAVFDPTGTLVVGAGPDERGRIFDAASGEVVTELVGHGARITDVDVDPGGDRVVTASDDGVARIWDLDSGLSLISLVHPDTVRRVAFSPDGELVATFGGDGRVRLFDSGTATELASTVVANAGQVSDVAWMPDGSQLVVPIRARREVALLDGSTLGVVVPDGVVVDGGLFCAAEPHPSGEGFVVGSRDGQPQLVSAVGAAPQLLTGHGGLVCDVDYSPDGALAATASNDGTARVWSGSVLHAELLGHRAAVNSVSFDPTGTQVLTASDDGEARIWDVTAAAGRERFVTTVPGLAGLFQPGVLEIDYLPDGETLIVGPPIDGPPGLWSFAIDGATSPTWRAEEGYDFAVHPGGGPIATNAGLAGAVGLVDPDDGSLVDVLPSAGNLFITLTYTHDGERLVVGDQIGRILVYEQGESEPSVIDTPTTEQIDHVDAAAEGGLVGVVSITGEVFVVDLDRELVRELDGSAGGGLHHVAMSPDGALLVVTGSGGAGVWDTGTGERVAELDDEAEPTAVEFSLDGGRIATTSTDGRTIVWEVGTWARLAQLPGRPEPVVAASDVAFSRDGSQLATVDAAGLLQVRLLDPAELVELARSRVTRSLTADECDRYVPDGC